jgi:membrane associated rhomboid family serine protease
MAKCNDCGVELPREEMFGTEGDLRCSKCAANRRNRYHAPRVRFAVERGAVTIAIMVLAGVATFARDRAPIYASYLIDAPPAIWHGEIWRFVTTILPHGGIFHLGFNLYWMWMFGRAIETWMGSLRYCGFILLSAFGSMAGSFLIEGPAIGLSGVVFAYVGLLFALRKHKDFAAVFMQPYIVQQFVIWFFLAILISSSGLMGIGNGAHAAGALVGWLTGLAVLHRQRLAGIAGVVAMVVGIVAATQYMPWDPTYALYRYGECTRQGRQEEAQYWLAKATQLGALDDSDFTDEEQAALKQLLQQKSTRRRP